MKPPPVAIRICTAFLLLLACMDAVKTHAQATTNPGVTDSAPLVRHCKDSAYIRYCRSVEAKRLQFAKWYRTNPNHRMVFDSAKQYLQVALADSMFSYWKNTPWEFYGTTETPGCSSIACGYFVTTVLRDLGFRIPRYRWAEGLSGTMIQEFCAPYVVIHVNQTAAYEQQFFPSKQRNIYIAGLSNHVGFYIHDTASQFYHSSFFHPETGVMQEPAEGANPFALSPYRALGLLFADDMLLKWFIGRVWK